MQVSLVKTVLSAFDITSIVGAAVPLERRKNFYTTHEEHDHLPGPRNPPPTAIFSQLLIMLSGENPATVLIGYNKKADKEKEARFGRKTNEDAGAAASLGFSDIPFLGKL